MNSDRRERLLDHAHAYLTVEMDVVWSVIEHDLAPSTELWP